MTEKQIKRIKEKIWHSKDHEYKNDVYIYWIDGNNKLCRAFLEDIGRTSFEKQALE